MFCFCCIVPQIAALELGSDGIKSCSAVLIQPYNCGLMAEDCVNAYPLEGSSSSSTVGWQTIRCDAGCASKFNNVNEAYRPIVYGTPDQTAASSAVCGAAAVAGFVSADTGGVVQVRIYQPTDTSFGSGTYAGINTFPMNYYPLALEFQDAENETAPWFGLQYVYLGTLILMLFILALFEPPFGIFHFATCSGMFVYGSFFLYGNNQVGENFATNMLIVIAIIMLQYWISRDALEKVNIEKSPRHLKKPFARMFFYLFPMLMLIHTEYNIHN